MAQTLAQWPTERLTAVFGLPGDRTDDLLAESARIAARTFDRIIVREDGDKRGREPGAVAALIERTVRDESHFSEVDTVLDELDAMRYALSTMRDGEVIVSFCDGTDAVAAEMRRLGASPIRDYRAAADGLRRRIRVPA